jgi:hypothetical protein
MPLLNRALCGAVDVSAVPVTPVSNDAVRALFYITATADPGLLPRLIAPVAKLGHVPSRVHASSEAGDGSEMTVDLRVVSLNERAARLIEHNLRSVIGVRQVIAVIEPA